MYQQIAANKRKTIYIMFGFVLLIAGLAWLYGLYVGEPAVGLIVLAGSAIYAFIMYYSGSRLSLAVNGAKEITKRDNVRLWRTVENLAITNGMPMPKVYLMDDPAPNAFATGRDPKHAAVCATTGLLGVLDDSELEGVMAHELAHVKNYDIRVSMIAFALSAVISILADFLLRITFFSGDRGNKGGNGLILIVGLVAVIVAPLVATLIQLAISRRREYLADATGALTTRYPEGLARALEKIGQAGSTLKRQNSSTAHLFLANPLRGKTLAAMFSTHPPIADRVAKLRGMGL